jgi:carboxyvinyl-carboxyphosphonate phosphorylmutase
MNHGSLLKKRFEDKKIILSVGIYDALSARIAAMAGAPSIYITGYGAAASHLGMPDIGLLSFGEMIGHVRRAASSVDVPVIADADTGYGGLPNVWRTVREYEAAGVDLIQLEDQMWPKRCGHMEGKQLVPAEEMISRIKTAVKARRSPDFLIMARTDAIAVEGFDSALDRAARYREAGADVLFVEAPRTVEQMAEVPKQLDAPLLANMVEGGKTPFLSVAELQDLGYAIALFPISTLLAATQAVQKTVRALTEQGTTKGMEQGMADFSYFNELIGLKTYLEISDL